MEKSRSALDTLEFNLSQYDSIESFVDSDEMFWSDLTLEYIDGYYIYNSNQGTWFSIERKYWYTDNLNYLFELGTIIKFHLIEDLDIIQELNEERGY